MDKKLCLYDFVFVLKSKTHHIKKKSLDSLKKKQDTKKNVQYTSFLVENANGPFTYSSVTFIYTPWQACCGKSEICTACSEETYTFNILKNIKAPATVASG